MSVRYDVLEKIDYVRKYAEELDGGEVKKIDFDIAGQFLEIEYSDYPIIRHCYFAIPEKKQLKDAVRYAICEIGINSVAVVTKKHGNVVCENFFGEKSVDGVYSWFRLGVDED